MSTAAQRAYYERNRDAVIAASAARRLANPETDRAYKRDWYERNRESAQERARQEYRDDPAAAQARAKDWQQQNPERRKLHVAKNNLKRNHGLTLDELTDMLVSQEGHCYLCGQHLLLSDVNVDHDHRCCRPGRSCPKCRRGLTHATCNTAIGMFGDDPDVLRQVADNLEAAQLLLGGRVGL